MQLTGKSDVTNNVVASGTSHTGEGAEGKYK